MKILALLVVLDCPIEHELRSYLCRRNGLRRVRK